MGNNQVGVILSELLSPTQQGETVKHITPTISLDSIISSSFFYLEKWSLDETLRLKSNAAFDTLRLLLIRLYEAGQGRPLDTSVQLSIGTVADKLGLSRYWTGILVHRLADAGWVEIRSEWTSERMKSSIRRESVVWRISIPTGSPPVLNASSRARRRCCSI